MAKRRFQQGSLGARYSKPQRPSVTSRRDEAKAPKVPKPTVISRRDEAKAPAPSGRREISLQQLSKERPGLSQEYTANLYKKGLRVFEDPDIGYPQYNMAARTVTIPPNQPLETYAHEFEHAGQDLTPKAFDTSLLTLGQRATWAASSGNVGSATQKARALLGHVGVGGLGYGSSPQEQFAWGFNRPGDITDEFYKPVLAPGYGILRGRRLRAHKVVKRSR